MPYPHLSDARHPRPLAIPALVILHGNSVLHYVKLLYRYVKKSLRIGCVIPHCKLQRGITQPILDLSVCGGHFNGYTGDEHQSVFHVPSGDDREREGARSSCSALNRTRAHLRRDLGCSTVKISALIGLKTPLSVPPRPTPSVANSTFSTLTVLTVDSSPSFIN